MIFQFQLSKKHLDFQKSISEYIEPLKGKNESEILEKLASDNYILIPAMDGSRSEDYIALVLLIEELSKSNPKVANALTELLFAQEVVYRCAKPEHQCNCAKKISTLEKKINVLYSEPGNYELKSLATTITKQGDKYLVKGRKIFAPENKNNEIMLVIGNLVSDESKSIAIAAVKMDNIQLKEVPVNLNGSQGNITLAEIETEVEEDKLFMNVEENLEKAISNWRIFVAASALGLAYSYLTSSLAAMKGVKTSENQLLTASEGIQFSLADMFGEIEGGRLVCYYSAALADEDKPSKRFSAIAKVQATEAAVVAANHSANLIGNIGNIFNVEYLESLQLAYNRQIKDGTYRNSYNVIYEEALAKR